MEIPQLRCGTKAQLPLRMKYLLRQYESGTACHIYGHISRYMLV